MFPILNPPPSSLPINFYFCLFLAMTHSLWNLSSRDQPVPHAVEARSPNHWTTKEVPLAVLSKTPLALLFQESLKGFVFVVEHKEE